MQFKKIGDGGFSGYSTLFEKSSNLSFLTGCFFYDLCLNKKFRSEKNTLKPLIYEISIGHGSVVNAGSLEAGLTPEVIVKYYNNKQSSIEFLRNSRAFLFKFNYSINYLKTLNFLTCHLNSA
jgi:hypothetical protein